jgi:hypothetical protein
MSILHIYFTQNKVNSISIFDLKKYRHLLKNEIKFTFIIFTYFYYNYFIINYIYSVFLINYLNV